MKSKEKLLVFGKPTIWFEIIERFLKENFESVKVYKGDWGAPFPKEIQWERKCGDFGMCEVSKDIDVDYLISFCCPWILPKEVLSRATKGAINFHPAPPKYPGIGGYNYAIYNQDIEYGCTVHEMIEKVDTGKIKRVDMFFLEGNETIQTLKEKTMTYMLYQFYEVMDDLLKTGWIHTITDEYEKCWEWEREPYTRKEFQEFCRIRHRDFDTDAQLELVLRALYFPHARDPPYIEINGKKWRLSPID